MRISKNLFCIRHAFFEKFVNLDVRSVLIMHLHKGVPVYCRQIGQDFAGHESVKLTIKFELEELIFPPIIEMHFGIRYDAMEESMRFGANLTGLQDSLYPLFDNTKSFFFIEWTVYHVTLPMTVARLIVVEIIHRSSCRGNLAQGACVTPSPI
jgi:hypothetical protein